MEYMEIKNEKRETKNVFPSADLLSLCAFEDVCPQFGKYFILFFLFYFISIF